VVAYRLRHFHVFNDTLSLISGKARCINQYLETVAIDDLNLSGRQAIKLCHAFDLNKLNIVAILELVTLILMNSNDAWVRLRSTHDDQ
jgi:hypothetical protein